MLQREHTWLLVLWKHDFRAAWMTKLGLIVEPAWPLNDYQLLMKIFERLPSVLTKKSLLWFQMSSAHMTSHRPTLKWNSVTSERKSLRKLGSKPNKVFWSCWAIGHAHKFRQNLNPTGDNKALCACGLRKTDSNLIRGKRFKTAKAWSCCKRHSKKT